MGAGYSVSYGSAISSAGWSALSVPGRTSQRLAGEQSFHPTGDRSLGEIKTDPHVSAALPRLGSQ